MNHTTETNRRANRGRLFAIAALAASGVAAMVVAQPAPPTGTNVSSANRMTFTGITAPSTTIKLGFDIRGVVDQVHVKDNDRVTTGQPILNLLDTEQRAELQYARLRADTSLQVQEAEETYNVQKVEYERKKQIYEADPSSGSSELEMKKAEAEMNVARIRVEQAKHEAAINTAQADAQEARLARMTKVSPIDGEVRQVIVKPGEQVDETKPVVEIVDLDPLYVEVTLVDTAAVRRLNMGQTVRVRFPGEQQWRDASVNRIDTQADASSGTHPFRLSLPNPDMRKAGERVEIQMPTDVAAAN